MQWYYQPVHYNSPWFEWPGSDNINPGKANTKNNLWKVILLYPVVDVSRWELLKKIVHDEISSNKIHLTIVHDFARQPPRSPHRENADTERQKCQPITHNYQRHLKNLQNLPIKQDRGCEISCH